MTQILMSLPRDRIHANVSIAVAVVAQTKADRSAAELAQVLRRERAGQARIADAQSEVEELRGEMDSMKEAFARSAPCWYCGA